MIQFGVCEFVNNIYLYYARIECLLTINRTNSTASPKERIIDQYSAASDRHVKNNTRGPIAWQLRRYSVTGGT